MSPSATQFDVIVIGGGTAAVSAASRAGSSGLRTALVNPMPERRNLAADLEILRNCVQSARVIDLIRRAKDFGVSVGKVRAGWKSIRNRAGVDTADRIKQTEVRLHKSKVAVYQGNIRIENPRQVTVTTSKGAEVLPTRNLIIAAGTVQLPVPGFSTDGSGVVGIRQALNFEEIPQRLVVLGGDAAGVEIACLFNALGAKVTVVVSRERVLPDEDHEIAAGMSQCLAKQGIDLMEGAKLTAVKPTDGVFRYTVKSRNRTTELEAETAVWTRGVVADTDGLGLEAAGVKTENGNIVVNKYQRTAVEGIWAIGECTGQVPTTIAEHQARCAVDSVANRPHPGVDPDNLPRCVFGIPQVAALGLTEQQAKEQGHKIQVGKAPLTYWSQDGFVKFVVGRQYGEVLGVHMLGDSVCDLIGEVVLGRMLEVSVREFAEVVRAGGTPAASIGAAAADALGEELE